MSLGALRDLRIPQGGHWDPLPVLASEQVSGGHLLRKVRDRTPEGKISSCLTTELKIPPGLIALSYKQRLDAEP